MEDLNALCRKIHNLLILHQAVHVMITGRQTCRALDLAD